jgi:hypothetical protein
MLFGLHRMIRTYESVMKSVCLFRAADICASRKFGMDGIPLKQGRIRIVRDTPSTDSMQSSLSLPCH